jgi:hypothetical protein
MGTVFYIHRLSKLIDEMVKDLGLTLTISDENADVKLASQIPNIQALAASLGVKAQPQQLPNGNVTVVFTRK